jgi:protein tyrosine phosphatase (PTP) superfamily phosphohydrolase (DUF442 family)
MGFTPRTLVLPCLAVLAAGGTFALFPSAASSAQKAMVGGLDTHPTQWASAPRSGPISGVPIRNFGVVAPGCLYRSAQPEEKGFQWMSEHGFRSVINLRSEADDGKDRLKALGMDYLSLPIPNDHAPTDEQARTFLAFVREPSHWPALVHCKDGIGRASTMAALARYAIDGWSMGDALHEARDYRPFHFWMFGEQRNWLNRWQDRSRAGEFHPSRPLPTEAVAGVR